MPVERPVRVARGVETVQTEMRSLSFDVAMTSRQICRAVSSGLPAWLAETSTRMAMSRGRTGTAASSGFT